MILLWICTRKHHKIFSLVNLPLYYRFMEFIPCQGGVKEKKVKTENVARNAIFQITYDRHISYRIKKNFVFLHECKEANKTNCSLIFCYISQLFVFSVCNLARMKDLYMLCILHVYYCFLILYRVTRRPLLVFISASALAMILLI